MEFFRKNYKVILAIIAIGFITVSIFLHTSENYFWYRLVRGIFGYSILILLLTAYGRKVPKWIVGFLVLNGASCITTIWFENEMMASITMILAFVSFLMFFSYVIPKIRFVHFTTIFSLLFIVILFVNGYLFIQLIEAMKDFTLSETQYVVMLLSGICASLIGFFALHQNHIYNNSQSMTFMILVILLIFAGIFRGIGYYNLVYGNVFIYLARILYALSLWVLFHFAVMEIKIKEDGKTLAA
tara:strand:- start:595 stop:1320 length:726 start_codon:yes stop_codon:yes gene_type:complete